MRAWLWRDAPAAGILRRGTPVRSLQAACLAPDSPPAPHEGAGVRGSPHLPRAPALTLISDMPGPALIVIDVQRGFRDPSWGVRNNPACEDNIAALLAHWRSQAWPVVYVRHDSELPGSPLAPGQPGNELEPILSAAPDVLVTKHVNSAFYGEPDLRGWLDARAITAVTVCGITTNHCCETTARMAGNLGYETTFVIDATYTFARRDLAGGELSADELMRVTAANLHGEFATVVRTAALLAVASG